MTSRERRSENLGRRSSDSLVAETIVSPRYSFMNRGLQRLDTQTQAGVFSTRYITYPTPSGKQAVVRDFATTQGMVMGQKSETNHGTDRYVIPGSARPISHDASMSQSGVFSYDDVSMFSDLGEMLGKLTRFSPESPLSLSGEIGDNIAIIEFTRRNERKLFFVPGFEAACRPLSITQEEALHVYVSKLSEEMGERFERNVEVFVREFEGS